MNPGDYLPTFECLETWRLSFTSQSMRNVSLEKRRKHEAILGVRQGEERQNDSASEILSSFANNYIHLRGGGNPLIHIVED